MLADTMERHGIEVRMNHDTHKTTKLGVIEVTNLALTGARNFENEGKQVFLILC
jgi:hypothetical protein